MSNKEFDLSDQAQVELEAQLDGYHHGTGTERVYNLGSQKVREEEQAQPEEEKSQTVRPGYREEEETPLASLAREMRAKNRRRSIGRRGEFEYR